MKRFIKIVIPILLAVSIIASIGWYLFIYDTQFTWDQLMQLARWYESQGNMTMAIRLYDMAYEHSNQDSGVAIELATLFRNSGNYTKAEYTLSNAIADGGSLELYVELCKLYVEQDKLIDAVNMLDNVADTAIKEQLDSMRPAAPVATPEQGHYTEYRKVTFQPISGQIYASANGDFPSTANGAYKDPIVLGAGETTILALTLGENGLVSPLQTFRYTVAGVIEEVTFIDAALESNVRQLLGVNENHVIYSNELWEITSLIISEDTRTLIDLSWFPYLEQVTIKRAEFPSLEPLAGLTNLTDLVISDTTVSSKDLAFIAKLPKLSTLTLHNCGLSGISELSAATQLTWLDLSKNYIGNLSALSGMTKLEYVDLSHNALTSLEVFGGLPQLAELYVSYNSIESTAPLAGCASLNVLDITGNLLVTLEGLDALPSLRTLYAAHNQLTDVSMLAGCTTIGDLNISNNLLTDITALSTLSQLLTFDFSYNQVTAIPEFDVNCALISINGSHNMLKTMKPLGGLKNLNVVLMNDNAGITTVATLTQCFSLVQLNVLNTGVHDVTILREAIGEGVTITYSPV